MSDIQSQLDQLVFKGFVEAYGWKRLADVARYLKAIEIRIDKLPVDPTRDRLHMQSITKVQEALAAQLAKVPRSQPVPAALIEARWWLKSTGCHVLPKR